MYLYNLLVYVMATKKFFWKDATGLKADIERHRAQESEIRAKIEDLEKQDQSDAMVASCLLTYRNFLYHLELSKAEVTNKIGKKK